MIRKICSTPSPGGLGGEHDPLRLCRRSDRCGCPEAAETAARASPTHDDDHRSAHEARSQCGSADVQRRASPRDGCLVPFDHRPHSNTSGLRTPRRRPTCLSTRSGSGLGMIGRDETTARARARLCPGGVRSGGRRRDRRAHRHEGRARERVRRQPGPWAPITVARPNVPVIGGGIPVDIDPMIEPERPQHDADVRCPARIATGSRSRTPRTLVPSTRSSGIRRPGCTSSRCSVAPRATAPSRA